MPEEMRIVDTEAQKPEGAGNEWVEQLSFARWLLTGRLQTEITNGVECLDCLPKS